jgi:cytochrome c oxidase subunit 2
MTGAMAGSSFAQVAMSRALWLPPNGALHGAVLDRLLEWNLSVLAGLLVLAHLILVYALVRRRGRGAAATGPAAYPPIGARLRWMGPPGSVSPRSTLLPRLWTAELVPTLLCCLLFGVMAITSERLWAALRYTGPAPGAMQVEVVGVQFQWYFRYPGSDARFGAARPQLVDAAGGNPLGLDPNDKAGRDDVVSSVLILPVGREVDLRLRAHDVIHGFFVPGMRLKQNAVPGLELHVHFTPVTAGIYPILCTQVCGSGHARMQAQLRVVPPEQFESWIAAGERAVEQASR